MHYLLKVYQLHETDEQTKTTVLEPCQKYDSEGRKLQLFSMKMIFGLCPRIVLSSWNQELC